MTSFTFEAEGLDELGQRLDEAQVRTRISINEGLREIGSVMVPTLKRHTPVGATHHLRNTTVFQILGTGDDQVLQVRQGARTSGGTFYGRFVRGGRGPGRRPPVDALVPWVVKVLGIPGSRARGIAFIIARKIGKKGIKPNPYHERALNEVKPRIQQIVTAMGTKVTAFLAGR